MHQCRIETEFVKMMQENELTPVVVRAQSGDREAYGQLVERFQSTVYAVALSRLRNPTEAQELTQEVFLHGMNKLDQLREAEAFPGWLRQITVRMAINRLTRRGPMHGAEQEVLESAEANTESPLDVIVRAEQRAELWKALQRLKPTDKATLVAFYIRGLSLKEMSAELDVPVGTIKRRLHVARNRLKVEMEKAMSKDDETAHDEEVPVKKPRRKAGRKRKLACV